MVPLIKCLYLLPTKYHYDHIYPKFSDRSRETCYGGLFGDTSGIILLQFSIKTYIMGTHYKLLSILMSTHNIFF